MENISCPACKKENSDAVSVCPNCSFPFEGTEEERSIHIGRFISRSGVMDDSSDSVKKTQRILYAIAVYNALFLAASIFGNVIWEVLAVNVFILLVFLFSAIFIKKNPFLFTIIPLVFFVGIAVLNYTTRSPSILGVSIQVLIVGVLLYNIYLIKVAGDFKKKYKQ